MIIKGDCSMEKIFKDKNVLVLGLGGSGLAAVRLLLETGAAKIIANDKREADQLASETSEFSSFPQVNIVPGGHPESILQGIDLIVKSPGIPPKLDLLQKAVQKGIKIIGEVELAALFFQGMLVGITGTNGKTTTTSLVGEIFRRHVAGMGNRDENGNEKNASPQVHVAGNVGLPLSEAALHTAKGDIIVAELSSFQLDDSIDLSMHIAAVLNISPDHLDYHETLENYIAAKKKILLNQSAGHWAILNWDDPVVRDFASRAKGKILFFSRREELPSGVILKGDQIVIREAGQDYPVCRKEEIRIPGLHNLENALAATAVAWVGGAATETIAAALRNFAGVAHRLEPVRELSGVYFVNDSKGTNPDAAINALRALPGPKILIAGGFNKNSDFSEFAAALREEGVKRMILLGETAALLREAALEAGFQDITMVGGLASAVDEAFKAAGSGDTVLLSPACASWDMFKNFEERGRVFKEAVFALKERVQL